MLRGFGSLPVVMVARKAAVKAVKAAVKAEMWAYLRMLTG